MKTLSFVIFFIVSCSCFAQQKSLKSGMVLHKSFIIKKGIYRLYQHGANNPVIILQGNDITVDFNNSIIVGSAQPAHPENFTGVSVLVHNSKNITIRNLRVSGFKIALLAENVQGMKLVNCNFSDNYRPKLHSTKYNEDMSDWLSYHQNYNDEWKRYGAGIYLVNCNDFEISRCKVSHVQNALLMHKATGGRIFNNDFSFNSGLGIGLYQSSYNKILYNKVDFNIRGYSDSMYSRGQDSGGILLYEQSCYNLIYKNSITHGGDGIFLWAGPSTMETGKGGCNENVLMENDCSYAAANGIEATFSSNRIIHNRIFGCTYGIWGGYSYDSRIEGNQFRNNKVAIAIEHGHNDTIFNNLFYGDSTAISLWAAKEDSSWSYIKHADTRSHGYFIIANSFNKNRLVYNLSHTDSLTIFGNNINSAEVIEKTDSLVEHISATADEHLLEILSDSMLLAIPEIDHPLDPFKGNGKRSGRNQIRMTAYGPYDFTYPLIWEKAGGSSYNQEFEILGPATGTWKFIRTQNLDGLSAIKGKFPSKIYAKRIHEKDPFLLQAKYTGPAFTNEFGQPQGKNAIFDCYEARIYPEFNITYSVMDSASHQQQFFEKTNNLSLAWWGGFRFQSAQYHQFNLSGKATYDFQAGNYNIGVTWVNAFKLFIDGQLFMEGSGLAGKEGDQATHKEKMVNLKGKHEITVTYAGKNDFECFGLSIEKVGPPGIHE